MTSSITNSQGANRETFDVNKREKSEKKLKTLEGINPLESEISFWTPVIYHEKVPFFSVEGLRELVDAYFHVEPRQVAVVETLKYPDNVLLKHSQVQPYWITLLKIVSYFTLLLPLLMLTAKYILRRAQPFFIQQDKWIVAPPATDAISLSAAREQSIEKTYQLQEQLRHKLLKKASKSTRLS